MWVNIDYIYKFIKCMNSWNGFWQKEPGVLEALRSNVPWTIQNETELEEYLTAKKAKYHKVCSNRSETTTIQRQNQNSNAALESNSSGSRSSRNKDKPILSWAICNEEDIIDNLHADGSYHEKQKVVNSEHNKMFTDKWKEMALNSRLLALLSTGDLNVNAIFYHRSCYKAMEYDSEWSKYRIDQSWSCRSSRKLHYWTQGE